MKQVRLLGYKILEKSYTRLKLGTSTANCFTRILSYISPFSATQRDELAPEIVGHPGNVYVDEGESVTFTCQVAGYPDPRVSFYRNGKKLATNENVLIGKSSTASVVGIILCIKLESVSERTRSVKTFA